MTRINLFLLLIIACMSSCSRYYYKPNGVNAPLLAASQDLHVSANIAGGGEAMNVQAAYSPVNHLGIIGGISTYSFKADNPDPATGNVDASAHLGEIGAGYYFTTNAGRNVRFIYDIYGGAGFGAMKSDVNMNALRLFLQPGIGLRTHWFDCSFNLRICDLSYSNLNPNGHDNAYLQQQNLIDPTGKRIDKTHYLFAEPALTLRGGYKFIKFQAQYILSAALSDVPWRYSGNAVNFGLNFQLEDLLMVVREKNKPSGN
jgi:hypothetical protein